MYGTLPEDIIDCVHALTRRFYTPSCLVVTDRTGIVFCDDDDDYVIPIPYDDTDDSELVATLCSSVMAYPSGVNGDDSDEDGDDSDEDNG
jgi:hypothetical protein